MTSQAATPCGIRKAGSRPSQHDPRPADTTVAGTAPTYTLIVEMSMAGTSVTPGWVSSLGTAPKPVPLIKMSCPGCTDCVLLFGAVVPSAVTLKATAAPCPPVPSWTKVPNPAAITLIFAVAATPSLFTVNLAGPSGVLDGRMAAASFGAT